MEKLIRVYLENILMQFYLNNDLNLIYLILKM